MKMRSARYEVRYWRKYVRRIINKQKIDKKTRNNAYQKHEGVLTKRR